MAAEMNITSREIGGQDNDNSRKFRFTFADWFTNRHDSQVHLSQLEITYHKRSGALKMQSGCQLLK